VAEIKQLHGDDDDPRYRLPPHDFEAEQALIGAVLHKSECFYDCAAHVKASDFADTLNGRIWETIERMFAASQRVTMNTLRSHLMVEDDNPVLKKHGGMVQYLGQLYAASVGYLDAVEYAKLIRDYSLRRSVMQIGAKMMADAQEAPGALKHVDEAERQLMQLNDGASIDEKVVHISTVIDRTLERLEYAHQNQGAMAKNRVMSGLTALDNALSIEPGDFLVIAGAASMGKSALLDNFMENAASRDLGALLDNHEMPAEQLIMRRIARRTGVNVRRQQLGQMTTAEWQSVMLATDEMRDAPIFFSDQWSLTPAMLRAEIKRLKRKRPVHLVGVDYIQLMSSDAKPGYSQNRATEIGAITRALRMIAKEENVVMIALSQLSRQADNRDGNRPQLSDLRESGSIEQDATHVLFIYREEYYLARQGGPKGKGGKPPTVQEEMEWLGRVEDTKGKAELIIAKARNDELKSVMVEWDGLRTRYNDLSLDTPGGPVQADAFEPT
jgi:replicative DNA helicase